MHTLFHKFCLLIDDAKVSQSERSEGDDHTITGCDQEDSLKYEAADDQTLYDANISSPTSMFPGTHSECSTSAIMVLEKVVDFKGTSTILYSRHEGNHNL